MLVVAAVVVLVFAGGVVLAAVLMLLWTIFRMPLVDEDRRYLPGAEPITERDWLEHYEGPFEAGGVYLTLHDGPDRPALTDLKLDSGGNYVRQSDAYAGRFEVDPSIYVQRTKPDEMPERVWADLELLRRSQED